MLRGNQLWSNFFSLGILLVFEFDLRHGIKNAGGAIRKALHICQRGDPTENENCIQTTHHASDNIGIHAIPYHDGVFRMDAEVSQRAAHHQRVGFAYKQGDQPGRFHPQRARAPRPGPPSRNNLGRVGPEGAISMAFHMPDVPPGDQFKVEMLPTSTTNSGMKTVRTYPPTCVRRVSTASPPHSPADPYWTAGLQTGAVAMAEVTI